jgi:cysteine-rich repeat protein
MLAAVRTSALVLALVAVVPQLALPATPATTANDVCGAAADPCIVSTDFTVTPGATLDFGSRAVDVKGTGSLNVTGGSMTILAGSLRLEPGAALNGSATATVSPVIVVRSLGTIRVEATTTSKAKIDVTGSAQGGDIDLAAAGDILIDGNVLSKGTFATGVGGNISLRGVCLDGILMGSPCEADVPSCGDLVTHGTCGSGNHVVNGSINASGNDQGGFVAITAAIGSVTLAGSGVNASGGEDGGGEIDVLAGSALTTSAPVNVNGGGLSGDGGTVSLISGGPLVVGDSITGQAAGSTIEGGGTGADITITSFGSSVRINADIDGDSGSPDGSAGSLDLNAATDFIQSAAALISLAGRGVDSTGGDFSPSAAGNMTLGPVDVSGASGGGGSISATAGRILSILGEVDGDGGGDLEFAAGGPLVVGAEVHDDAYQNQVGGLIMMMGCDVTVPLLQTVSAKGPTGQNVIQAAGTMTIQGTLESTMNVLEYLDPLKPPIVTGTVTPPATPALNPNIKPCGVQPAVCGNGVVEDDEECDDSNNTACDGCSQSCQFEGCGNGVVECGEQCDDGPSNGTPGAGCSATCQLIGGIRYIPGSHTGTTGCFLEFAINNPNTPLTNGFPNTTQKCVDGDPACDIDGATDGQCTFALGVCLNKDDTRLPACHSNAITKIDIRVPAPLNPSDSVDSYNTSVFLPAVRALGPTVVTATTTLAFGSPDPIRNHCSALAPFHVPHPPGASALRSVRVAASDDANHHMDNRVVLACYPNNAVCGNGSVELGEQCDDGNTISCDGCSSNCKIECGNGVVDCGEQCDHGALNGTAGDSCTATCKEAPPALRIPGGGPAKTDCSFEWALKFGTPAASKKGIPKYKQKCIDNDPTCDTDPTVGNCHFKIWACLGGEDLRLACLATPVGSVEVLRPLLTEIPVNVAARNSFVAQLSQLGNLNNPGGERCTGRFDADVPVGKKYLSFKTISRFGTKADRDTLQLGCFAPPTP